MTPTSPNQTRNTLVASDDARMLTALLPSSSAPISRSRAASSRLTMPALGLPSCASRSIVARDDAVSAVSLPAKKNDSSRQRRMAATASQSSNVVIVR